MVAFEEQTSILLFEFHEQVQNGARVLATIDVVAQEDQCVVGGRSHFCQQAAKRAHLAMYIPEHQEPRYGHFSPQTCQIPQW